MIIRRFKRDDGEILLKVFLSSVRNVASRDYTPQQIAAWLPNDDQSIQRWLSNISQLRPYVVEVNHKVAGYADLQRSGLIDHFYVSGEYTGQGVGTSLMKHIASEARRDGLRELTAFVSLTAEPFFLRHGFSVVERCFPVRHGVTLPNTLMRKVCDAQ